MRIMKDERKRISSEQMYVYDKNQCMRNYRYCYCNYSRLGLHLGPFGLFGRHRPSPAPTSTSTSTSSSPFPCCGVIVIVMGIGIASIPGGGVGGIRRCRKR